jgi:hypothetical protein
MTGRGVPDDDMPSFRWPTRQDTSTDDALAALLARAADATPGLTPAAEVLAALTAAATTEELAGEARALAAFRRGAGVSAHPQRSSRRRPTVPSSLLSAKAAAAAAVAAVLFGGAATAAFANALPAPLQSVAHQAIGAPAARLAAGAHPASSKTPVGPDATGSAAFGLCTAYAHAKAHGRAAQRAVAFRNLATAAGGTGKVAAYCATVPHGAPSRPAAHGNGRPATHPSPRGSGKPPGLPGPHGSGKPATHPSPHGGGRPTGLPAPHHSGGPTSHP